MATLASWVESARSYLMTGLVDNINALTVAYTAGGTGAVTLNMTAPLTGIGPNTRISIGTNTFYIIATNSTAGTVTAYAGMEGTTDQNAALGALVRIGPRFTDAEVVAAINADLLDLSSPTNGLFQVATVAFLTSDATVGYDMVGVTDLIDIIEVRSHNTTSTYKDYGLVDKVSWRLNRNADVADFPSGMSLQLVNPGASVTNSSWGTTLLGLGNVIGVRVLYRKGFTQLANITDAQSLTGLPATAYDIPPMGAAMRLIVPREIRRNFTEAQGDTRRAGEVMAGAVANSYRPLAALRQQRILAEATRLQSAYPVRIW